MKRFFGMTLLLLVAYALWMGATRAAPPDGGFPIERVSVSNSEAEGNNISLLGFPTNGGRYVLFSSEADNLVPGDTNDAFDVFVRDTISNTTTLISRDSNGNIANDLSVGAAITPLGRFVLFYSNASDIVTGDTNNATDGFLRDVLTNTTIRVTVGTGGTQANDSSTPSAISAGGRYITFSSSADNLVANDTNGLTDCFLYDRISNTTIRLVTPAAPNPDGPCTEPTVTEDGQFVAFVSNATNLVPNDTNNKNDVFVMNVNTREIRRVSVSSFGEEGDDNSYTPVIALSEGGYIVAFRSEATNLVFNDDNFDADIFIHHIASGETTVESTAPDGNPANGDALSVDMSIDGKWLFFISDATNLVPDDTNLASDAFMRSLELDATIRISTDATGIQAAGTTIHVDGSDNGAYAAISSIAANLVPGDTNGQYDVFLIGGSGENTPTPTPGPTTTPSSTPTGTLTPATATSTPSVTPTGTLIPPTETPTPSVIPTGTLNPTESPTITSTGTVVVPPSSTPATTTPTTTPDPTEFPATPTPTTVPLQHHLYLPLTQR